MMDFILIRHGDTLWTQQKRYQGTTDVSLSPEGKKKMRALAKTLRSVNADWLCTSSLARGRESGKIIAQSLGIKAIEDSRLNEVGFGQWEGKTSEELLKENNPIYKEWMKGRLVTPKGGESFYSLQKRIRGFLKDCLKHDENKKIVIVSHSGAIRMIVLEALGLPIDCLFYFRIDPASVTILRHYADSAQLVCLNNMFSTDEDTSLY